MILAVAVLSALWVSFKALNSFIEFPEDEDANPRECAVAYSFRSRKV
jgi:hypothetical protein